MAKRKQTAKKEIKVIKRVFNDGPEAENNLLKVYELLLNSQKNTAKETK